MLCEMKIYYKHMQSTSYVFIAGGMGITPFRSIIASALKKNKELLVILIHCVSEKEALLFEELFWEADRKIGLVYVPLVGTRLSKKILDKHIPHLKDHIYYLSGSEKFIGAVREILRKAEIDEEQMKTDIFSGY